MVRPEDRNYAEIERLEAALRELRGSSSTARETEAIREIGYEIAIAIREVGALLTNVGWEQSYAADRLARQDDKTSERHDGTST